MKANFPLTTTRYVEIEFKDRTGQTVDQVSSEEVRRLLRYVELMQATLFTPPPDPACADADGGEQ